jgi:hypothetical protein
MRKANDDGEEEEEVRSECERGVVKKQEARSRRTHTVYPSIPVSEVRAHWIGCAVGIRDQAWPCVVSCFQAIFFSLVSRPNALGLRRHALPVLRFLLFDVHILGIYSIIEEPMRHYGPATLFVHRIPSMADEPLEVTRQEGGDVLGGEPFVEISRLGADVVESVTMFGKRKDRLATYFIVTSSGGHLEDIPRCNFIELGNVVKS